MHLIILIRNKIAHFIGETVSLILYKSTAVQMFQHIFNRQPAGRIFKLNTVRSPQRKWYIDNKWTVQWKLAWRRTHDDDDDDALGIPDYRRTGSNSNPEVSFFRLPTGWRRLQGTRTAHGLLCSNRQVLELELFPFETRDRSHRHIFSVKLHYACFKAFWFSYFNQQECS